MHMIQKRKATSVNGDLGADVCHSFELGGEPIVYRTVRRESWMLMPPADNSSSNCVTMQKVQRLRVRSTVDSRFSRTRSVLMRHSATSLGERLGKARHDPGHPETL